MRALKSIILVDDDETTNFLNQFFIRQSMPALDVYVALNGEEALALLADFSEQLLPSMVLLDTQMPVMNGWTFLEQYEIQIPEEVRVQIKVILLTAMDSSEIYERVRQSTSIFQTAQKPLSDVILKQLVASCTETYTERRARSE